MPNLSYFYKKSPKVYIGSILCVFFLVLSNSVVFATTFFVLEQVVKLVGTQQGSIKLWIFIGLFLIANIIRTISMALFNYSLRILAVRVARQIRSLVYQNISHSTYASIDKLDRSILQNLLNDNLDQYIIKDFLYRYTWVFILDLAIVLIIFGVFINTYALIIVLVFAIIELSISVTLKWYSSYSKFKMTIVNDAFVSKFSRIAKNFSIFLFSDKLSLFFSKNNQIFKTQARDLYKLELRSKFLEILPVIFVSFKFVIFIGVSIPLYTNGLISIEAIIATASNMGVTSFAISYFVEDVGNKKSIIEYRDKLNQYFEVLVPYENEYKTTFMNLSLKDVSLTLDDKKIFKNVNLELNQNDKLLISGKSGSGKSALLSCLLNHQVFSSGEYELNNQKTDSLTDYSRLFSYSDNKNIIFDGNAIENITMFDSNINQKLFDQIVSQLKIDYIQDWTLNINTLNLSEGQKQKIVIARSFYQNRDIFIFDESLTNLDKEAFELTLSLISNLKKTVILIAHNLPKNQSLLFNKAVSL